MAGNDEDYLDSLLKAASVEVSNDSALELLHNDNIGASAPESDISETDILSILDSDDSEPAENMDASHFDAVSDDLSSYLESFDEASNDRNLDLTDDLSGLTDDLAGLSEDLTSLSDETGAKEDSPSDNTDVFSDDFMDSLLNATLGEAPIAPAAKTSIEEPETEEPMTEEVLSEEPAIENLLIEEPAIENLLIEEPATEELLIEEPATEELLIEEPATEELLIEEPATEDFITEEPALEEALFEEPMTEEPVAETSEDDVPTDEVPVDEASLDDLLGDLSFDGESGDESVTNESDETSIDDLLGSLDSSEETLEDSDTVSIDSLLGGSADSETLGTEDVSNLSADDIQSLLNQASDVSSKGEMEIDLSDEAAIDAALMGDLTKGGEGDDELAEINDLLQKMDSNDEVQSDEADMFNLLTEAVEESALDEGDTIGPEAEDKPGKKKKEKKKKEKKSKKGKNKDKVEIGSEIGLDGEMALDAEALDMLLDSEKSESKKSVFGKFMDFLTASDDEDEEESKPSSGGEASSEGVEAATGENQEILEEIDASKDDKKGKKKKGKKKKGKEAPKEGGEEGDDEGAEGEASGKKKKKPKKEKVPKEERKPFFDVDPNEKKLSKKNVIKIFILAASICVAIILVVKFIPSALNNEEARKAYYKGDYETTYQDFFGEKLSESDQILFDRSEILLKIQHKYDAYLSYCKMDMKTEALDQLLQAVYKYEDWLYIAETRGAKEEFVAKYQEILTALSLNYGLSEEDAWKLINIPDDLAYSLMIQSVANQTEYIDPSTPIPGHFVPEEEETEKVEESSDLEYEDMLPEEME